MLWLSSEVGTEISTSTHRNAKKKNSILMPLDNLRQHRKLCIDLFACNNKMFSASTNMSSNTAVFSKP